jgi:nucleoside-diphosphate-sugar epimerase
MNKKLKIVSERGRKRPKGSEVERLFASNKRAREILGWQPQVSLDKGLEMTVDWFHNRGERYYKRDFYAI